MASVLPWAQTAQKRSVNTAYKRSLKADGRTKGKCVNDAPRLQRAEALNASEGIFMCLACVSHQGGCLTVLSHLRFKAVPRWTRRVVWQVSHHVRTHVVVKSFQQPLLLLPWNDIWCIFLIPQMWTSICTLINWPTVGSIERLYWLVSFLIQSAPDAHSSLSGCFYGSSLYSMT